MKLWLFADNSLTLSRRSDLTLAKSQTIDYDALDAIHRFKAIAKEKHIHLELKNIPDLEVQGDLH